jgi:hypothetical protein
MEDMVIAFPVEPVSVGAVWRRVSRLDANGMQMVVTNDYHLEAIEGSTITLASTTNIEVPPQQIPAENGATMRVERGAGTGNGRCRIDLRTGRTVGASTGSVGMAFAVDTATGSGTGSMELEIGLGLE